MKVTTEREDDVLVATIDGRIDSATVSEFQHLMETAINSAGLRAILIVAKTLWKRDARLALYSLQSSIQEVFTIAGFDKIIQICSNKADALDTTRG